MGCADRHRKLPTSDAFDCNSRCPQDTASDLFDDPEGLLEAQDFDGQDSRGGASWKHRCQDADQERC
jgi:hypothetical protein